MALSKERVIENIRAAFKGVVLGRGVGLLEGRAIDDYAGRATRRAYRARDEKLDWASIPVDFLNRNWASLGYVDAEGMRFYLPAFLMAEMTEDDSNGMVIFLLTSLSNKSQFTLLSSAQRAAVSDYMRFIRDNDDELEWPEITSALETYWEADQNTSGL
jgi:hypothetical protein